MLRSISLYSHFFAQNLKALLEYRWDFWLGVIANAMQQASGLLFIGILFSRIPSLNGWNVNEVVFIYGFVSIPAGLCEVFLNGAWQIPSKYVWRGNLDYVLIRPVNDLLPILVDNVGLHGVGLVVFGTGVLAYASNALGLVWTVPSIVLAIVAIVSGTMIYGAINLITGTLAFWATGIMPTMTLAHHLNEFSRYPLTWFPRLVQFFFTLILPFAFAGFFPAAFLVGKEGSPVMALLTPVAALVLSLIAYVWWRYGVRHYQSTGS
jgi:ABC-2 type transport system permease protein